MNRRFARPVTLSLLLALSIGCSSEVGVYEDFLDPGMGDPDPEEIGDYASFTDYNLPIGTTVEVCHVSSGLNNRSGPGTDYMVLRVLKPGFRVTTLSRSGNWYRVEGQGKIGWSYGYYLCTIPGQSGGSSSPSKPTPSTPSTPAPSGSGINVSQSGIIAAAKAFVGFSYWWGGAAFKVGSTSYGKCYSSTYGGHSGSYGADCSGFAGKVWQLPNAMPFEQNRHPYSTYHYDNYTYYWSKTSKNSMNKADALVYNSGSSGHIVIYESGSAWGSAWTYEAKGCSYGVVHNLRTVSSSYQARRRNGV